MIVLVTGASGFVGRWLVQELGAAGHAVVGLAGRGDVDLEDRGALVEAVRRTAPEAVVHLAAVSSSSAAERDPEAAVRVNVGGTINLFEACASAARPPVVLVASSSEVYGWPAPDQLPLSEEAALQPRTLYAMSKVAQESIGMAYGLRTGLRVAIARAFNHSGPGQRGDFALPAFANRIRRALDEGRSSIAVGDVDVARDFLDVRDVVVAYRLLLEQLASTAAGSTVLANVCADRPVVLRTLLDRLCQRAGVHLAYRIEPGLIRAGEPREIRGDSSRLRTLTGWAPLRSIEQMVDDLWDESIAAPSPP